MGPEFILVNISIDFVDTMQTGGIEQRVNAIDRLIKQNYSQVKRVFVEAEAKKK